MKNFNLVFRLFAVMIFFLPFVAEAQTTVVIGNDESSSSTRGPFQRSSTGSSSVYSRANLVYLASELAAAGITPGSTITQIEFNKKKTGKLTASGNAFLQVYMRNTSNTAASSQGWTNVIAGSTLVGNITYNLANNFPDAQGYMSFPISPFVYTGGTLEIAVDWNSSGLTPADPADPNRYFDTSDGAVTWRWSATSHVSVANKAGSSPGSTLSNTKSERCDIRITYSAPTTPPPTGPTTLATIGNDQSSSSTRGPFQRSSTGSSSVYSRANLVYLASELAAAGITPGSIISQINFDKRKTGKLTASGDAFLQVYMRNTSNTAATANSWSALSGGSTLVGNYTYNLANNFPDAQGWMQFPITPFVYTGGTLEIAVDWNSSGLTPADPADPNRYFDTSDGAVTWRWSSTNHVSSVTQAGSSGPPSNLSSNLRAERADIQIAFSAGTAPGPGTGTAPSVWSEDFDGSNSGPTFNFAATGCIVDDSRDHYGVMCNAGGGCPRPLNEDYTYLGAVGNYFAARDINGDPCNNDNPITATAAGIDISGCSGADFLFLCFDIAESSVTTNPDPTRERRSSDGAEDSWDGAGGDPNGYDTFVTLSASVDGGASFPITGFAGAEGIVDSRPGLDLNCDGTGTAGAEVSSTFATFCFQVAEQGSTLDLDLTVGGMTTDGEDVAIDNITLYCTDNAGHLPVGLSPSCTAAANALAVPTMGEWALFILFLMIINMGAVFMFAMQNRMTLATENQTVSMNTMMRSFPFNKSSFTQALKHAFGIALLGFAAIYAGWGEIVSADFIGMAIAIPLIAYFIHLFFAKK